MKETELAEKPSLERADSKIDRTKLLFSNKSLFFLLAPLVVEQLLSLLTGLVDSIMVAQVSEAAVSGVSLIDSIMVLIICVFAALASGGAVVAGQYLGQGKKEKAKQGANELIWFMGLFSLGVMALLYVGRVFILNVLFGQISAEVWGHANTYLLITAASVPFLAIYHGGAAAFRTMGTTGITMGISSLANAINIVGNAICIYGLKMGVEGVAIPTLISRMVSAFLVSAYLLNPKRPLALERKLTHKYDWAMVKRILGIGIPSGLENGMFQIGKLALLSLVSTFSTSAMTANAITGLLATFQILPGQAVGMAQTTVISRCVGANDYKQVRYYNRKMLMLAYILLWVFNMLCIACMSPILSLYNLTPETEALTRQLMWIHSIGSAIIWPISFVLPGTFRAAGDVRFTMVTSIASMWLFRLLTGYYLAKVFGLGVVGIWLAMMVDWTFRSCLFIWRYFSGKWQGYRAI